MFQMFNSESSTTRAPQVCTPCRLRKRRCDKALPICSLCSRRRLACKYEGPQPANHTSTPAVASSWPSAAIETNQPGTYTVDFPTILFLDPSILQHRQLDFLDKSNRIPEQIMSLLGDMKDICAASSRFFFYVHPWMPFISKKRFYDLYLTEDYRGRSDVVLLLLAIRLITELPPTSPKNPRTPLYNAVKHFYLDVEGSSSFSVLVLQAGVLLALYEVGHGIYPAAYLSIGACARYAHALGINSNQSSSTKRVLTIVEVEERRRVWWAIVILDRFVSIGCPERPFATADPKLDDLLPADDAEWDAGVVKSDELVTMSSPMTGHMSKFALLCQAARLLGQVLDYVTGKLVCQDDTSIELQLDRTLHSMLAASLDVATPDQDQITFIYSALVALYTPWFYVTDPAVIEPSRRHRMNSLLHRTTEIIMQPGNGCFEGRKLDEISPWGMFFAYQVCAFHLRSNQHGPRVPEVMKRVQDIFSTGDIRWNAAGMYLRLLEAQEAIYS